MVDESQQKDFFDVAAERAYQEFVDAGGLDTTHIVDEDWERMERTTAYCQHDMPFRLCGNCKSKHRPRLDGYPP